MSQASAARPSGSAPALPGRRRAFGRLTYATLALSALILVAAPLASRWPAVERFLRARQRVEQLVDPAAPVRYQARGDLLRLGESAFPALVRGTRRNDPALRAACFEVLGSIVPLPVDHLDAVRAGLTDDDPRVRAVAADAYGSIFPGTEFDTDPLAAALDDPDPTVRLHAALALRRIVGPRDPRPPAILLRLLAAPRFSPVDEHEFLMAVQFEADQAAAADILRPRLTDPERVVRQLAAARLRHLPMAARLAIDELTALLADPDPLTRCHAGLALTSPFGPDPAPARRALASILDHPDLSAATREQVRWVLETDLTAGSEFSQPVHVLHQATVELDQAERARSSRPRR